MLEAFEALWSNEMSMSSESGDEQGEDGRARWERPAFRHLVANLAEQGNQFADDGMCVGGFVPNMECMS